MRGRDTPQRLGPPYTSRDALRLAWLATRQALHYLHLAPLAWCRGAQVRWNAYWRDLRHEMGGLAYLIARRGRLARQRLNVRIARVRIRVTPTFGVRGRYRWFIKGTWPRWRYRLAGLLGPPPTAPALKAWRRRPHALGSLVLAADAAVIALALTGLLGVQQAALAGTPFIAESPQNLPATTSEPSTPSLALTPAAPAQLAALQPPVLGPSTAPSLSGRTTVAALTVRPTGRPPSSTGTSTTAPLALVSIREEDLDALLAAAEWTATASPETTASQQSTETTQATPSASADPSRPPLVAPSIETPIAIALVAPESASPTLMLVLPTETPWRTDPATVIILLTDTPPPSETPVPTATTTPVPATYTAWTPALADAPGWIGPGQCALSEQYGPVGTGTTIWPAGDRWLSGYDFSGWHPGIDISATYGAPIYVIDSGVVVYAGWNNQGYGNLIIVDHANGTWSAYAHLSQLLVGCLQGITQGQVIAAAGSTGNSTAAHLHFEAFRAGAGQISPWTILSP